MWLTLSQSFTLGRSGFGALQSLEGLRAGGGGERCRASTFISLHLSAHLHAMRLIVRTARLMDPANTERWTVQIADEWGVLLLTVLFPLSSAGVRESLQFPGSSPPENTAAVLRACAAALRSIGAEGE